MANNIEEIFNDCFERLLSGESYESCLRRYPKHATELDIMLRTVYDVKRRAYPIQPRPEFKYWSRARMLGVQDYFARRPVESRPSAFHWKRSWAMALSAILVIVLASGGTAAASSNAMPDQPLYGVKMAVEQAQVVLTLSEAAKAELHAQLAEKRAEEISQMAILGKSEQVLATTINMNYQLEQASISMMKLELQEAAATAGQGETAMPSFSIAQTSPADPGIIPPGKVSQGNMPSATSTSGKSTQDDTATKSTTGKTAQDNTTTKSAAGTGKITSSTQASHARDTVTSTNTKSIAVLEKAFEKAPDSVKPAIAEQIKRTKQANDRIKSKDYSNSDNKQVNPPQKSGNGENGHNRNDRKSDKDRTEGTREKSPTTSVPNLSDKPMINNNQKNNGVTGTTSNQTGTVSGGTENRNSSPITPNISPVTVPQLPKIINSTTGTGTNNQSGDSESVR